jgi:hypothetical protein
MSNLSDEIDALLAKLPEDALLTPPQRAARASLKARKVRHDRYVREKAAGTLWRPAVAVDRRLRENRGPRIVPGAGPVSTRAQLASMGAANSELIALWRSDCWSFLTGKDADDRPLIWTKDEGDEITPFKPFPAHPYLRAILEKGLFGERKVVVLDKCRQMMMSTLSMLALYWVCLFHDGRSCFVSKTKEDQGAMLINDKIRGVHSRTPMWFQQAFPVSKTPQNRIIFPGTESQVYAVTQNAAVGEFRGNTVSIAVIDEAAFQEKFPEMLQAAGPMASRIWAITTPNVGNPGADMCYEIICEGTR